MFAPSGGGPVARQKAAGSAVGINGDRDPGLRPGLNSRARRKTAGSMVVVTPLCPGKRWDPLCSRRRRPGKRWVRLWSYRRAPGPESPGWDCPVGLAAAPIVSATLSLLENGGFNCCSDAIGLRILVRSMEWGLSPAGRRRALLLV
jgi:hypothetical protein